jgi:far upstream element-binding protein
VSIADAIAKARGIAAEKGLSYEAGRGGMLFASPSSYFVLSDFANFLSVGPPRDMDPRAGGRSHRRSRSPSPQRSPPRAARENFRDNYNPYRDERRDDRRGGNERNYARERSFSPRPAGRGTNAFSPQPRPYGGPNDRRGGDDNTDTINIESNLVGLIIGRQGESLRKIEADTGTRIQFLNGPESTGSVRLCKITGSRASRNDAKAEISRIISENGPGHSRFGHDGHDRSHASKASTLPTPGEGESTMQIMVPDRTVGLIIGRGGETIRDLQERSGCHVNIVGENKSLNGLRPVNLMGTPEASQKAQDLIHEIVESDTRHAANQSHHNPTRGPPFSGGDYPSGDKVSDSIFVRPEAVGMIIGKGMMKSMKCENL